VADDINQVLGVRSPAQDGTGSQNTPFYAALVARYRPAYRAASRLSAVGTLLVIVGIGLLIWGVAWMTSGHNREEMAAPLILIGGFASAVAGGLLRVTASILRAVLDRTAFAAPGLDSPERVRLAFEAGGEQADPTWGTE